ncbi:MAG: Holliday junction resolvase RuvX [Planctomycetota bacterium]
MTESNPFERISLPSRGRLLGIDFGTVRVGIALCDEGQIIASPYETYNRRNERLDRQFFESLAQETAAVGLVVGLPVHMSGDESQKSIEAREFGNWLSSVTGLPVTWVDERYSTAFARELLRAQNLTGKKAKAKLDKVAAQAILSVYLESSGDSSCGDSESLDE